MIYTYVLRSDRDGHWYAGTTRDLRARVAQHRSGAVRSTALRRPMKLICYEARWSLSDAFRRERFLKTGKGKRYLRNRLSSQLAGMPGEKLERH